MKYGEWEIGQKILKLVEGGKMQFKKEIEKLIEEIDNSTKLLSFEMKRVE